MRKNLRRCILFRYLEQLIFRYKDNDVSSMSAQISYYLILSFFPFLLFLINLVSFTPFSSEILIKNINIFIPIETGTLVKGIVVNTLQAKSEALLLVGMIGSLWSASHGIYAIIKGLNKAYGVEESRNFIKLNSIALISTIGVIIMIIAAFVMIVFGKVIGNYIFGLIGAKALFNTIWSFLRYYISITLMFITFYLMYKYVPNKKSKFKNIIGGTIFTTLGWSVTSLLFSFYINNFSNYEKVYGSLGGIIILLVWIYISSLIILIGGEINAISIYFESREINL